MTTRPSRGVAGLVFLSLALLASPALADPVEDVTRVLRETADSKTRTLTFFLGLASLGDLDVSGDDLQGAIRESGLEGAEGLLGAFMSGMNRIKKKGDRVTIYRSRSVTAETGNGGVQVAKTMEFRVRARGPRAIKLDKMKGAKASKAGGSFHPLRWLELSADADGITSARLNAGYGFGFNKTVSMVLKRPEPKAAAGIADRLGG